MARSPLLDLYDPYGILAEQARLGILPGQDPMEGGRQLTIADLMPEEEKKSRLRELAEVGTSGLSAAADFLDTGGSAIRGLLVGKPLSVFGRGMTGQERVSGRDVLREYGLIGKKDNWLNFAGGLAVEILTDPLTYLNPFAGLGRGAMTNAAKAAEKAGLTRGIRAIADEAGMGYREFFRTAKAKDYLKSLPRELRDEAEKRYRYQYEKLGGKGDALEEVLGAGMTFSIPGTNINVPLTDGKLSAKALDTLMGKARTSDYIGPALGRLDAMFDADVQGIYRAGDPELNDQLQKEARKASRNAMLDSEVKRRKFASAYGAAEEVGQIEFGGRKYSIRDPEVQRAIIDWVEDPTARKRLQSDAAYQAVAQTEEWRKLRDEMAALGDNELAYLMRSGLNPTVFKSQNWPGMRYVPRKRKDFNRQIAPEGLDPQVAKRYRKNRRIFGAGSKSRRTDLDMPSHIVRAMTMGEKGGDLARRLRAASNEEAVGILDEAFREASGRTYNMYDVWEGRQRHTPTYKEAVAENDLAKVAELERDIAAGKMERYRSFADRLRNLDQQFETENLGLFDAPMYDTVIGALESNAKDAANTRAVYNILSAPDMVKPMAPDAIAGGDHVSLAEVAKDFLLDKKSPQFKALAGGDPAARAVSKKTVEALKSLSPTTFSDEPVMGISKALQKYMSVWKGLTLLHPAYLTRNLSGGTYSATAMGAGNPLDLLAAQQLARGNTAPLVNRLRGAYDFAGMSDEEIVRKFKSLAAGADIYGGNLVDEIGQGQARLAPGSKLDKLAKPKRFWQTPLRDWLGLRGWGQRESTNPIIKQFDRANTGIEDTLRGGMFINQLRKGVDAGAAGDLIRMAQVDYRPQAFTSFENQWLKNIIPFYSFQRGILPSIREQLLQRPGGLMGQTMRAINVSGRPSEENFTREDLRKKATVPLADYLSPEGKTRYITSFGLPFEDAFNLIQPGVGKGIGSRAVGTFNNTLGNIAGNSNPIIKYIIEQATGKQLFSGRNLDDTYSVYESQFGLGPAGRALQNLVANLMPGGSRINSIAQQLTDNRLQPADKYLKAFINNTAPFRLTDVDQEQARSQAARDMLNQLLQETPGVRTYENLTVPEEALSQLSPEQQRMYLLYRTIQSEAQKRARERKKAEEAAALLGVPQT